jgi:AraC-like DNA-binding protein
MISLRSRFRAQSYFTRLALACGGVVLLVAFIVALGSMFLFHRSYNAKLAELHRLLVGDIASELRTEVFDRARAMYVEIATELMAPSGNFFGIDDPATGNAVKLRSTYQYLNALLDRNIGVANALTLYYPKRGLVLSSSRGLTFFSDLSGPISPSALAQTLREAKRTALWLPTDSEAVELPGIAKPESSDVTMLWAFPLVSGSEDPRAIVSVGIRGAALRSVLDRFASMDDSRICLVDSSGIARLSAGAAIPGAVDWHFLSRSAYSDGDKTIQSATRRIGGTSCLVSALALGEGGWFLACITPLASLYRSGILIELLLALVALAAIGLGLFGSLYLARRFNSPMEETIRANRLLIKKEFVNRLLDGSLRDLSEFETMTGLIGLDAAPSHCRALYLSWRFASSATDDDQARVIKYRFCDELEAFATVETLACALHDDCIGALVIGDDGDNDVGRLFGAWARGAEENWGVVLTLVLGGLLDSPFALASSFEEARRVALWRYFFPEQHVMVNRRDLAERNSPFLELPTRLLGELRSAFLARDQGRSGRALAACVDSYKQGSLSASAARLSLLRIVESLGSWSAECGIDDDGRLQVSFANAGKEAGDIDELLSRLDALLGETFALGAERQRDRNAILMEQIKARLRDRLGQEVTLSSMASDVGLSPGYLSQLFKEETGTNFSVYLTELRLGEAERMLRSGIASVQDIGRRVGFNTPAYFIRRFKDKYGRTPSEYRRQLSLGTTTGPARSESMVVSSDSCQIPGNPKIVS